MRGATCAECRAETRLTGVVSAGSYRNQALQRGVHWLKFKNIQPLAALLSSLLLPRLKRIAPLPLLRTRAVLVPVPLHRRRHRQRGFNQSALLSSALSTYTGIPKADLLERSRSTWTQTKLPPELRKNNTTGAFSLLSKPSRPLLILIDDVTTTGSTLHSAASTFPEKYTIWGCTIARG